MTKQTTIVVTGALRVKTTLFFPIILLFIYQNMIVSLQKLLAFYRKNINIIENTIATTVNEFVINELVKLTML